MSTRLKSRPQMYPRAPFHIIRAIAFVCASVVSGILIYFCVQLKHDGFKVPWTFIVVLAATVSSLLTLLLSTIIYSCTFLSPLLNLVANVSILIVWTVGFGLLTWNMYGTLGHSCSRANWASDDGMMVCRTYKALYSFLVFGWLAQVAQIILDVRSRRAQTALGKYDKMMADQQEQDLKMDALHTRSESNNSSVHSAFLAGTEPRDGVGHGHGQADNHVPYGIHDYQGGRRAPPRERERERGRERELQGSGWAPGSRGNVPWDVDTNVRTAAPARRDDFGYAPYAPQTGYANNGIGYGPRR